MQIFLTVLMIVLNIFSVYLGVMALFTFKRRKPYPQVPPSTRFAVVIPARNEEGVVGNLIARLWEQTYPRKMFDVYVVTNNCTDRTAAVARAAGAKVIDCAGAVTCKGDVLHQAIEALMPLRYDAFAFFDADNLPDAEFLSRMNDALCAGERVCKGRLKAGNATQSWVAGGYGLYHALMEWTYSRPHSAAGFSSNLVGTGFVAHREVFEALGGWNTRSMCEDTEFAAQCSRIGYRVAWVPEALSYDEQVASFRVSLRQRRRWCRGMVQAARLMTPSMFSRSCPRRGMARDFGMLFVISHTAPLATILALISLPFQSPLMLAMGGAGLVLSYAGLALVGLALCALGGYPIGRMGATVALFPIFMASWVPLQVMALFVPVRRWSAIEHSGQPDAEKDDSDHEGGRLSRQNAV